MAKMSATSREFLEREAPDIAKIDDPSDVLDELYDLIMYKGFKKGQEEYNQFGIEAQVVYDDIYDSNF